MSKVGTIFAVTVCGERSDSQWTREKTPELFSVNVSPKDPEKLKQCMKARLSDLPKDRKPMKLDRRRLLERDRDHDRAEIKTESRLTGLPQEIKAKRYGRA